MHKPLRTLVNASVIGVLATGTASAAGFSLYSEVSPASIGNFAAGIAAEGGDAAIGWYNPAGLVLIKNKEVVLGGVGVFPSSKLNGYSVFTTTGLPNYVETFTSVNNKVNALVPSLHYAQPFTENTTWGLSITSPWGLSTDLGTNSPVRYQATFTEIITTNVSPQFGAKLTDNLSLGAGLDVQFARVKFNRMLGLPTIFQATVPSIVDSLSYNKGESYGVGFHVGALGMFNENHTRVGLNYQSQVKHNFHGSSQLTGKLASPLLTLASPFSVLVAADPSSTYRTVGLYSNPIDFPDIVTLSAYQDVNETIALLGSVVYTNWDTIQNIQLNNVSAFSVAANTSVSQVRVNSFSPQNWKGTWRFAAGANYHVNPDLMLRVGGGYEATPTNNIDRDVRLPDADRWALSVGAHYQAISSVAVDVGYTHLFGASNPTINRFDPIGTTSSYTVIASGKVHGDLVGAQLVWVMDQVAPVVPTK